MFVVCRFLQKKRAPQCKERKGRGLFFFHHRWRCWDWHLGVTGFFLQTGFLRSFSLFLGSRGGSTAADFDCLIDGQSGFFHSNCNRKAFIFLIFLFLFSFVQVILFFLLSLPNKRLERLGNNNKDIGEYDSRYPTHTTNSLIKTIRNLQFFEFPIPSIHPISHCRTTVTCTWCSSLSAEERCLATSGDWESLGEERELKGKSKHFTVFVFKKGTIL